jgi:very-short-patch-repair endonuclease
MEMIKCACGCGIEIPKYKVDSGRIRKDRKRKYVKGHEKINVRLFGKDNPFFGHKHTEETKKNWGKDRKGKTNIDRFGVEKANLISEKITNMKKGKSNSLKGKTYEEIHGIKIAEELKNAKRLRCGEKNPMFGTKSKPPTILKKSKAMIEKWKEKEYREKTTKAQLQGLFKRPTSYEKMISELCINNNLPFMYTGNGTFLVGNKNPDFINKKEKIAIEVFNNYHKILVYGSVKNYMIERTKYFSNYGYRVIFIREEEITSNDWEKICLNKINEVIKYGKR